MCLETYYHYTDQKGLQAILKSRKILKSSDGRYGPGVYLTKLSPEHGRKKVAENNWDGMWQHAEGKGKTNYAISVELPDHRVDCHDEIYLFHSDVLLDMTTYKLYSKDGDHEGMDPGKPDCTIL